jgi:hypothetical protein
MTRRWLVAGLLVAAALLALRLLLREDAPAPGEAGPLVAPRATPAVPEFDLSLDATADGGESDVGALQPLAPADDVADETDVTFVVLHADGVPARGCMVAVVAGEKAAWSALTDDDGTARGAPVAGPVTAWVGGTTLVPVAFPLAEGRGRHELLLPAGEIIDGWVVIDGAPPPEPVPLGLESDAGAAVGVPWYVVSALSPRRPGESFTIELGAFTGAGGAFRFSGLPAGWTGRFEPPELCRSEDPHGLDAHAPERGRVLELQSIPHIRFRIVSADERLPVPFAQGMVVVHGALNSTSYGLNCDAGGRGSVPMLRWEATRKVQLDLADKAGSSRVRAWFDIADSAHDVDLGDIQLSAGWSIPFRVSAPDGSPIAGAVGATECEALLRSEGTDAAGLGRVIGVPPGCAELHVGAARHEPARVPLPAEPPSEPIRVTLVPCASLDLSVRSADGEPRPGLGLALSTERHVSAADVGSAFHESALQLGVKVAPSSQLNRQAYSQPDGSQLQVRRTAWRLPQLGEYSLGCQEAGVPVQVALFDASCFAVWSETVRLEGGEQRRLEAVLSTLPQALDVLVTDEAADPLPGTDVRIRCSTGAAEFAIGFVHGERTDPTGRARFAHLYAPALDVTCEKAGYVPASRAGVAPGSPVSLVLSRGLVVTLRCTDPQGRPALVDGAWIGGTAKRHGERVESAIDEDGGMAGCSTWRFAGLQPGQLTIAVTAGGQEFTLEHDASIPEALLALPASGALVVTGLQAGREQASPTLHLRLEGSADDAQSRGLNLGHVARDRMSWPLVFPGRYRVELREGDRVLAGPAFVEVRAGETAQLELH